VESGPNETGDDVAGRSPSQRRQRWEARQQSHASASDSRGGEGEGKKGKGGGKGEGARGKKGGKSR
jgi:hypothetical protein